MQKFIKSVVFLIFAVILSLTAFIIYLDRTLPNDYYITKGGKVNISSMVNAVPCSNNAKTELTELDEEAEQAELKLLGLIPIKVVNIFPVETPVLVPCGEPFGIKLLTDGVIVVEVSSFETENGFISPGENCGLKSGDIIKSIDGIEVSSNEDVEDIISSSGGKALKVCAVRSEREFTTLLYPQISSIDNKYRAGIWVRDSSAGIGTMTFYDPETKQFGGLGHPVCDIDTGELMPLNSGEVVKVSISGVKKGKSGSPGELMGGFISSFSIGTLTDNTSVGLFGTLDDFSGGSEALPLGMSSEIKTGKAYIYTTISGTRPQKYEIAIEKIDRSGSEDSRDMVIRVTDERLLRESGGIVQGMSGSPIIQDGKIVGAVTHVFINNPTKGYAIFADTMYEQMKQAG
ncbi:MAG: SpoIVB peptidase [Oscillospiraceae bacterium]